MKSKIQLLKANEQAGQLFNGAPVIGWNGIEALYWGKPITNWQIKKEKIHQIIRNLINTVLVIFAVVGLVALGYELYLFTQTSFSVWELLTTQSLNLLIFWCSLATDSYLYYRLQREGELTKKIPKKENSKTPIATMTLEEITQLKRKKINDISRYFTKNAQSVVAKSWSLASKYKHNPVQPIHLLIALFTFDDINIIFGRLGISFANLKNKFANILSHQENQESTGKYISEEAHIILLLAYQRAVDLHQDKVDLADILEVLSSQAGITQELLYDIGIDTVKINNVVSWMRVRKQLKLNWERFRRKASLKPKGAMNRSMTAIATPLLDKISQDLTLLARNGYLMPCIGREQETAEIFRIMQGGVRRSVIMVGNPGVGKTTIAEGIAQRMAEENVPKFLRDKRIVSLDIAKLVSGVSASEAQQRLLIALTEIRRAGNIILFINDIHSMTGISSGREGSIDLAEVLAQVLEKSSVLVIATATPADYTKYLERNNRLGQVLEVVKVEEVDQNTAIQILQAKVGSIEYKYKVYFSYDALEHIVELTDRYLSDRYLPEKAIEILQQTAAQVSEQKGENNIVSKEDVAELISHKTGIPFTDISQQESEKLLNMEDQIHERIIGQEPAVIAVAKALRRARAEMRDTDRPIVNLLFLGPTGVGKTELAKTVAKIYFGDEKNMIRVDMSEYQAKDSVNRLIGTPGDDAGGYLTEAVRKKPFSLVLLDEIEKAHPDILHLFLQVMEDGRLTDTLGKTIDFTNIILIATSNAGTRFIQEQMAQNRSVEEIQTALMENKLHEYFRPEFLNRFDDVVVFKPLTMENVIDIANLMISDIAASLSERGISLQVTDAAIEDLAEKGYDPEYGARPLRRVLQNYVQDAIANYLIAGKLDRRDTIIVQENGKVSIQKAKLDTPLVIKFASSHNVVDIPMKPRKIHTKPTPLLGGIAVYTGIVGTLILLWALGVFDSSSDVSYSTLKYLIFALSIILLGGILDDRYDLKPVYQLLFPMAAIIVMLLSGIKISVITHPIEGLISFSAIVGTTLAGLWLFAVMYTTKILDGLDGLVSGITTIGAIVIFGVSLFWDKPLSVTSLISLALAGSFLGFLIYNWHPAKIFLGESGSLIAGFMLGVLAIMSGSKIATTLLVLGVPALDVLWAVIRRLRQQKSPVKGDRQHLHHQLLNLGLNQRQAAGVLYLVSIIFGISSFFLNTKGKILALVIIVMLVVIAITTVFNKSRKRKNETI